MQRNFEMWYGGVPRLVLEEPSLRSDESRDKLAALEALESVSVEQVRMVFERLTDSGNVCDLLCLLSQPHAWLACVLLWHMLWACCRHCCH